MDLCVSFDNLIDRIREELNSSSINLSDVERRTCISRHSLSRFKAGGRLQAENNVIDLADFLKITYRFESNELEANTICIVDVKGLRKQVRVGLSLYMRNTGLGYRQLSLDLHSMLSRETLRKIVTTETSIPLNHLLAIADFLSINYELSSTNMSSRHPYISVHS